MFHLGALAACRRRGGAGSPSGAEQRTATSAEAASLSTSGARCKWDELIDMVQWRQSAAACYDSLVLGARLGRGGFAEVYVGYTGTGGDGPPVAVKVFLPTRYMRSHTQHMLTREISLLTQADHPNIVRFLGLTVVDHHGGMAGSHPALVMELCSGGSLSAALHKRGSDPAYTALTGEWKHSVVHDVALGVDYLHAQGWMHRDIKPQNILLDGARPLPHAKVADFGLATKLGATQPSARVGTYRYMAPEVHFLRYTHTADVYSFGVLLWEVLYVEQPWNRMSDEEVIVAVTAHHQRPHSGSACGTLAAPPGPNADRFLAKMHSLMRECWHQSPSARPGMSRVAKMLGELRGCAMELTAELPVAPSAQHAAISLSLVSIQSTTPTSTPEGGAASAASHHTAKLDGEMAAAHFDEPP